MDLSVIICSIHPDLCTKCIALIRATAGVDTEFLIFDNRSENLPIAEVYNRQAAKATAPALLFVHEDALFQASHVAGTNLLWGKLLIDRLSDASTGAIGFAGSTLRVPVPGGWDQGCSKHIRASLTHIENGEPKKLNYWADNSTKDTSIFAPVVSLDGVAIAVRKDVWQAHPFDTTLLTGFHCYDIDFSVNLSIAGYTNYAMRGVDLLHLSSGNYSQQWLEATLRIFRAKWANTPTISAPGSVISASEIADAQVRSLYQFIFKAIRYHLPKPDIDHLFTMYRSLPHNATHYYRHLLTLLWQRFKHNP